MCVDEVSRARDKCASVVRTVMCSVFIVHIVFRLQRHEHWAEAVKHDQALTFSQDLRGSTQAILSTVTRALGREERTKLRNRPKSARRPRPGGSRRTFPLRVSKPRKAAKWEGVLAPRGRVVAQGHEHALFGQARPAVRWLQKRAQVSRLVDLGHVQLE